MLARFLGGVRLAGIDHRADAGVGGLDVGGGQFGSREDLLQAGQQVLDLAAADGRVGRQLRPLVDIGGAEKDHTVPGDDEDRAPVDRVHEGDRARQRQPGG